MRTLTASLLLLALASSCIGRSAPGRIVPDPPSSTASVAVEGPPRVLTLIADRTLSVDPAAKRSLAAELPQLVPILLDGVTHVRLALFSAGGALTRFREIEVPTPPDTLTPDDIDVRLDLHSGRGLLNFRNAARHRAWLTMRAENDRRLVIYRAQLDGVLQAVAQFGDSLIGYDSTCCSPIRETARHFARETPLEGTVLMFTDGWDTSARSDSASLHFDVPVGVEFNLVLLPSREHGDDRGQATSAMVRAERWRADNPTIHVWLVSELSPLWAQQAFPPRDRRGTESFAARAARYGSP